MKKSLLLTLTVSLMTWTFCPSSVQASNKKDKQMLELIETALTGARFQALQMAHALENQPGKLPRTISEDGTLLTGDSYMWVSGFYPGLLWMLYEDQPSNDELRKYADLYTWRVEPARNVTNNHDVGFMLNCSFGQGYRITHDSRYVPVLRDGAHHLQGRFLPKAGVTRSWEPNKKWKNPVIIDNMMNLEILELIGHMDNDQELLKVADSHAQTTMKNHFRPDYSTFHVIDYDDETGEVLHRNTAQGYSDESAWARGQSWGLYGYTMMYRETQNPIYLEQARHIANYLIGRCNQIKDKIPYWDYDCPDIPNTPRDASSGAIMASALVQLFTLDTNKKDAARWLKMAEKQLTSLSTPAYTYAHLCHCGGGVLHVCHPASVGDNGNFILMHSVGSLPGKSEVDVPLTYADYYYVEALLRLKHILENK